MAWSAGPHAGADVPERRRLSVLPRRRCHDGIRLEEKVAKLQSRWQLSRWGIFTGYFASGQRHIALITGLSKAVILLRLSSQFHEGYVPFAG